MPLAGTRVVDLSQNLAGPYATQILADFGADVVKVEPPAGDPARRWGPPFVAGQSPLFLCGNRNKRSVVLDLGTERGREALRRLTARAHVFVQAFRAGVIERLGFDYDAVHRLRPGIVYVSVTAFGSEGPLRDQPGYDPLMQAYGGLMSVTGHPDGPPTRVGTSIIDMGTGLWTAIAVMAELASRNQSPGPEDGPAPSRRTPDQSTHITSSLLDTSLGWMAYHLQGHLATGRVPGPMGSGLGMIAPYEAFPAAGGAVMIAGGNDAIFQRLCHALDLDALAEDPRFADNAGRVAHRNELVSAVAARTRQVPMADLVARLRDARVPCAPIQDTAEVATDDQVAASGMLRRMDGADPGYVDVAPPVRWDGERPVPFRPPPEAGEHTEEVLEEIGMAE
jgi:crotonobetainyl-CoA:carnitine CoA-transferase CaiB-like acyl-CoA transferase